MSVSKQHTHARVISYTQILERATQRSLLITLLWRPERLEFLFSVENKHDGLCLNLNCRFKIYNNKDRGG